MSELIAFGSPETSPVLRPAPEPVGARGGGAAASSLLSSASKIAFLLLALTACGGFLVGKLASSDFMMLCGMAFSFYFSSKGEIGPGAPPYAGK